jgi:predicted RNase H-like HicB family nuclease
MAVAPQGYILVTFRVYQEGDQYVSECVELGIASCGNTIDEAFSALEDATELYLDEIEAEGERERLFAERGITIMPGEPEDTYAFVPAHTRDIVSRRSLPVSLPAA